MSESTKDAFSQDGLDLQTLFVRAIPFAVTDEQLTEFFANFAPTKHAVVVKDVNKKSRGFGFVSFASEEDTKEALLKARKEKLNGQLLRVDIAKRRERNKRKEDASNGIAAPKPEHKEKRTYGDEDDQFKGKPKLIIRNMPWSCRDPNTLKNIFGRFGTVVDAHIPRKRDGKLCGFAFVTMNKISNCKNALENTKDLKIDGRQVAVDFAVQKNRWEDYKDAKTENKEDDNEEAEETLSKKKRSQSEESTSDSDEDSEDSEEDSEDEDEEAEEKKWEAKKSADGPKNMREDYSIFIRNVPYEATSESLAEHFAKFGPVKYALPVFDKETGLAKGTAFVAFKDETAYKFCVDHAPAAGTTSLLIDDDVMPEYVYEGRVLSVTPTLQREEANFRAEKNAEKRKEFLGKAPGERDRRNLFLLNEGKVTEGSKLGQLLSTKDMEIREQSYKLRVEQLKKNPSLHLSLTRLAIRNLPRAMNDKTLKALGRKAVVQFATEVKNGERHPLSQEEIVRSTKEKYKLLSPDEITQLKKKDKKHGIVKQAKVIMEVKNSTVGRSRGYGFIEYKDHKHALMGLRWLNVHEVTQAEALEGLTEEEKKSIDYDGSKNRRLCVEFAIENSNVVKRRRDNLTQAKANAKRKLEEKDARGKSDEESSKKQKLEDDSKKDGMNSDIKRLIGIKRKRKQGKK
ncbi:mRNA-binding ribosome biosynthesis protein NOP4 KNAG_0A02210 [Huiozyma naganishii CBS 8797]|uniref:RRM domain-containing protein n=1 Tax=Huiozyma naganishii (strain ATCC MYA-139 / BCRC 22969 / CBS 8797 / KCTC 17520 / NBRC 10181 / NCYC 3082 / Yp74L-3) TaxID=1071383 RepID=J7QZK2_HUIN7|nr:hypothetical protein KNAG_0A02210 [Kazachstania naganishii CBS 8797]CCK67910.1 hypothetical protein KNAG_0A02210 [Kazachstania naganishii CBS 8797]